MHFSNHNKTPRTSDAQIEATVSQVIKPERSNIHTFPRVSLFVFECRLETPWQRGRLRSTAEQFSRLNCSQDSTLKQEETGLGRTYEYLIRCWNTQ